MTRWDSFSEPTSAVCWSRRVFLLPPGFCLRCGHHENAHLLDGKQCEHEVKDYGEMDCQCAGLSLCAACEGEPEAMGMHVCGRQHL